MIIYNPDNTVLLNIEVDDTSAWYAEMMNRNDVTLEFSLAEHVAIPIGAYIEYNGLVYQLLTPAVVTIVNRRNYAYVATFETDEGKMRLWTVHDTVDGRVKFTLTARPSEHLALLVRNLNEREGANVWAVAPGSYDSGEIALAYNNTKIRDAITQLANACETEYEVYKSGGKIYLSLGKVEYGSDNPLRLGYGADGGFESGVKRSNSGDGLPVEVLYVQGGDRNIDPSTYYNRSHYLLLPRDYRFSFDGEKFNGEAGFDATKAVAMITDSNGYSVRLESAAPGAAEESLDLSDIYPKRVGTVSAVETVDSGAEYPYYNIADDTLGTGAGKTPIDFNEYMIAGEQFTIVFQSGMLVGREISVATNGYVLEEGRGVFKLCQETIDGFIMPGEGGYVPKVGDTYAVFGCALPKEYIANASTHEGAEFEMLRRAARYIYENKDEKQSFTGVLSPVYARKNWTTIGPKIRLGGCVSFTDESVQKTPIVMRIMAIKTYINRPYKPEITLSNEATKGTVGGSLQNLKNNFARTDSQFRSEREYTKRSFRDAVESQEMLAAALGKEFSEGISPVTIRTMSALIGSNDLQYEIFKTDEYRELQSGPTIDDAGNVVCLGGYIRHYSLGFGENDFVKSDRPSSEYYRWQISEARLAPTVASSYYLYIEASKMTSPSQGSASYLLSRTAIPFEPESAGENYDTSHWYFLLGTVSSEVEGSRSIATYNGFTEITPGMIRAMKWISNDGLQYIDFINQAYRIGNENEYLKYESGILNIKGRLSVMKSDGSYQALSDYISGMEKVTDELQKQIDGAIETWFYSGVPTLSNAPAVNWKTTEQRNVHLGDLYYDENTGKCYRFQMDGDAYVWKEITDTSIQAALDAAYAAQKSASDALHDAQDAQDRLTAWAADGVISPTEKQGIADEIARIDADNTLITDAYSLYGLGTPTAYNAAYTAYRTQLVALSAKQPETIAIPETFKTNQDAYYRARTAALYAIDDAAKKTVDAVEKEVSGYSYLKKALAGSTLIEGGLMLTSLIQLGQTEIGTFNVYSGINGIMDTSARGKGIAAWYGGDMIDGEVSGFGGRAAQSLFRFDGSGYLAGGNITWDKDGSGSVGAGLVAWDDKGVTLGDGIKLGASEETLGTILTQLAKFNNMFELDEKSVPGKKVIKAKYDGFYTEGFLSSLGINPNAGGTVAGASNLSDLLDVAVSGVKDGQVLTYKGGKWVNADSVAAGMDTTAMWAALGASTGEQIAASHLTSALNGYAKIADVTKTLTVQRNGVTVGTYNGLEAKTVNISVPTALSGLANDVGFITASANVASATSAQNANLLNIKGFTNASEIDFSSQMWTSSGQCPDIPKLGYMSVLTVGNIFARAWQIFSGRGDVGLYYRNAKGDQSGWSDDIKTIAFTTDIAWANLLNKPTTLSGYNISDAVTISTGQTITGIKTFSNSSAGAITVFNNAAGTEPTIYLQTSGLNRLALTWHQTYGASIWENGAKKYLGIKPDGTPHYQLNELLHAGNYSSYVYPKATADTTFVKKSGDTMTGALTVPRVNLNAANSTGYIASDTATNMTFNIGGEFPLVLNNNGVVERSVRAGLNQNGLYSLGTSVGRWSNVYSVLGNFSGQIVSGVPTGTAPFSVASTTLVPNLNADFLDGYHETAFLRSFWTNYPGWDMNDYTNTRPFISFTYGNNATFSGAFVDISANGYGFFLGTHYNYDGPLYYRRHGRSTDGGIGNWQQLACITDNVASATKLQTTRTIWGQSFNGTGNVDGTLNINGTAGSYAEGIRIHPASNGWTTIALCGAENTGTSGTSVNTWSIHTGPTNNFFINRNASSATTPYVLCNVNGNWGIGTVNPAYNLDVAGIIHSTTGIWSNGYVSCLGQNTSSDERLKTILGDVDIPLHAIANMPAKRFRWKKGGEMAIGTIAQYWIDYTPEAVPVGPDGYYTAQYGAIALLGLKTVASEIVKVVSTVDRHTVEIEHLRRENEQLRREIEQLRAA